MIAIVDYGMGNLLSVQKALESLGAKVTIVKTPQEVEQAAALVLPGVGAFGRAMENLEQRGLSPAITASIRQGKPFLGICLGMQLLFETSQEAPGVAGLGVFKGTVARLPGNKVPQIGWNCLALLKEAPLFAGLSPKPYFYFVHSYYLVPQEPEIVAAVADYHVKFPAALWRDKLFAMQFHPEKSGKMGLVLLNNFWKMVQKCS